MKRKNRRMRGEEHRSRLALTLLYGFLVFAVLLLAIVVSMGLLALLMHAKAFADFITTETSASETLLFMGAVSLVIGAVLALLTSRIPLRPVNIIINSMNRLASGDFSVRLGFGKLLERHPTMAELKESFNTLATELESTEMLRSDFINNFSHEFKTPIVSIAGFTKLLRRGNLTDAQKDEYLSVIEEESLRLASLATNVLNLTRVENQTILTDVTTFNLSEQLRGCVLLLEDKWEKKDLQFDLEFSEYRITANEGLLKQVWINLIDNAVKFTDRGGEIAVSIEQTGTRTVVTVKNEGPEIPLGAREHIFRKFYQADESHASAGSGVGLAVVKRILDLHSGTISVDCSGGTTSFTVTLPHLHSSTNH